MRAEHIFHILSILAFLAALLLLPWWTVDDAFISYRYGRNFAETGQMVWNSVGEPVEGYSGVLLPLLAALFLKVGIPLVNGIKVVALLATFGTALVLRLLLLRMGVRREMAAGAVLLFALAPIVYVHALSGLETNLFVFLILSFLYLLGEAGEGKSWAYGPMLGVVGVLCVLARPEGLMWVGVPMVVSIFLPRKTPTSLIKQTLLIAALIILIGTGLYFYWKLSFYGSVLPNTYFAKKVYGGFNLDSLFQAAKFCGYYLFFPFLAAVVYWFAGIKAANDLPRRFKLLAWTAGICFSITLITYLRSHLFMNYGSRFHFPFLPFGIALVAYAIHHGWEGLEQLCKQTPARLKLFLGLLVLLGSLQVVVYAYRFHIEGIWLRNYVAVMEQEWKPAAEYLKQNLHPDSKVVLYQDAGWIAYATDFECIDFGRLNDRYLATTSPSIKFAMKYFLSQDPDAAVFTSFLKDSYLYHEEGEYLQAMLYDWGYRLATKFSNDRDYPYHQFIYLKVGSGQ